MQHPEEYMCRLWNIAMHDYQESVTTGQTDAGQSDDYASQASQKDEIHHEFHFHSIINFIQKCITTRI